ncbi:MULTISPECIES: hypothetical protein [Pseudoalteromonas]|uniref:Uncharacterized protein n=1 Tax=Pseudoalteromonas luteoviolacea (strain 2ta16) TaxID=1353533 RepID=V4H109_PSEL2|nr:MULTISPECIES: hypothetical protein [Pseudoalteromonas]ESP91136.1 hypothetical protein PL2TA16_01143 [Pseudoalteromonas luteoviolacea 2ta16]KZN41330.1 hypothetical protein N483_15655 [Pseudoalteromonas luteoviolacea NCIMB 1944]MCG7550191.1 hypothetical protein [Pseudoalteromonas sp. Of7M-16]
MQDGQYSIYYKDKLDASCGKLRADVEANYILRIKQVEPGYLQIAFMKGFEQFLIASCHPTIEIPSLPIQGDEKVEFTVINDAQYGMCISQNSLPDKDLLHILDIASKAGGCSTESVFQLIQTHIIRDLSIILLQELENKHELKEGERILEKNSNRVKLRKVELSDTGVSVSTLDMKRILDDALGDHFDSLLEDQWSAIRSEKSYQNTGIHFTCHELDKQGELSCYEQVFHTSTPSQDKQIARKIIKID